MAPSLVLAYLGTKVLRGERIAVYAVAAISAVCAAGIMVVDSSRGMFLMVTVLVILAPLVRAARRNAGGFH